MLETLYEQLPAVSCSGCGTCCVSPTCTLVEFGFMMQYCQLHLPTDKLTRLLCRQPQMHATCEGNLVCKFIETSHCIVHPGRTGACRLFGLSALNQFDLDNVEKCHTPSPENDTAATKEEIAQWLKKLMELNARIYPWTKDPYFLNGLNIECWLDIYFDDSLDFDIFPAIRSFMKECFDLSALKESCRQRTGIREKIDKIDKVHALFETGDIPAIRSILQALISDYPLTGSYYLAEAKLFLQKIDEAGG